MQLLQWKPSFLLKIFLDVLCFLFFFQQSIKKISSADTFGEQSHGFGELLLWSFNLKTFLEKLFN